MTILKVLAKQKGYPYKTAELELIGQVNLGTINNPRYTPEYAIVAGRDKHTTALTIHKNRQGNWSLVGSKGGYSKEIDLFLRENSTEILERVLEVLNQGFIIYSNDIGNFCTTLIPPGKELLGPCIYSGRFWFADCR